MLEVDLNNGRFRKVDLNRPCYCAKCGNEITRDDTSYHTVDLIIHTHESGAVFCRKCKRKLCEYASPLLESYERELVKGFLNGRAE